MRYTVNSIDSPRKPLPFPAEALARARKRKIMIGRPMARNPSYQYATSLVDAVLELERLGVAHERCIFRGSSNLPRARNEIAARFLASNCTDLIVVDDDIGWPPDAIPRLLAADKPLVGAIYRKKADFPAALGIPWSWQAEPDESPDGTIPEIGGLLRFKRIGTGFMMIAREVFEKLIAAHPDWKRAGSMFSSSAARDCYYRFFAFPDDPDDPTAGEDVALCDAYRALGGEIWVDPQVVLTHVGEREFVGKLNIEPRAAPVASLANKREASHI